MVADTSAPTMTTLVRSLELVKNTKIVYARLILNPLMPCNVRSGVMILMRSQTDMIVLANLCSTWTQMHPASALVMKITKNCVTFLHLTLLILKGVLPTSY